MKAVFKRELRFLFGGLTFWGALALLLTAVGAPVFFVNVRGANPHFADNILYFVFGMALFCGLICVDAFPGEHRAKTERALYALPVRSGGFFLGKLLPRLIAVLAACAVIALYPIALALISPSSSLSEGLVCVVALCALGMLFVSAALCCSAFSRSAVCAFIAYAALIALSWFLPKAAPLIEARGAISPLTLIGLPLFAGLLAFLVFSDILIGFIGAAIVLVPVLLNHLLGTDSVVFGFIGRLMRGVSVFDPLRFFQNGLLDFSAVIDWLALALPFIAAGILAVAARRQGKRRAL